MGSQVKKDLENQRAVESWFEINHCGGLILPDEWYGRPFDSQHHLTSVQSRDGFLKLFVDDDDVILTFQGLLKVRTECRDLVLGPFGELTVNNGDELGIKSYSAGRKPHKVSHAGRATIDFPSVSL